MDWRLRFALVFHFCFLAQRHLTSELQEVVDKQAKLLAEHDGPQSCSHLRIGDTCIWSATPSMTTAEIKDANHWGWEFTK